MSRCSWATCRTFSARPCSRALSSPRVPAFPATQDISVHHSGSPSRMASSTNLRSTSWVARVGGVVAVLILRPRMPRRTGESSSCSALKDSDPCWGSSSVLARSTAVLWGSKGGVFTRRPRRVRCGVPLRKQCAPHLQYGASGGVWTRDPAGHARTCLSAYEADALWCRETSTRLSHRGTEPRLDNAWLKAPTTIDHPER